MSSMLRRTLEADRQTFNHKVALARKARSGFETDSLSRILTEALDPLLEALDKAGRLEPGAVAGCFDLALEIAALAPRRSGTLEPLLAVWTSLAAHADQLGFPRQKLARITNATLFLHGHPGFDLPAWLDHLRRMPPDSSPLLDRLVFSAWVSGFAPLRGAALQAAERLEPTFLAQALDCQNTSEALAGLRADRWWQASPRAPKVAYRLGGCAALEGRFEAPPQVRAQDGQILVQAGSQSFRLHADRFGAQLLPCGGGEPPEFATSGTTFSLRPDPKAWLQPAAPPSQATWDGQDLVVAGGRLSIPWPATGRSLAVADGVVAAASPFSFFLLVVAP